MQRLNSTPRFFHFAIKRRAYFPNSVLPVLLYKKVFQLPKQKNKAAEIIRQIFSAHQWSNSWKNGIYDFHHYHSTTHECLGVAMGSATIILGGPGGKRKILEQGDLLIIPAGVGHKCVSHSADFFCVGAYPKGKEYDINKGTVEEYKKALPLLKKIPFGKENNLSVYWK
ncbi:MAG TPA: cupin domain-containing protein [Chitinophagales bacterium]|nr:cupin domain-containing protein [Chitinophagales bacterium]